MNEQRIQECIDRLILNITDNYIFIYTPPKVGSTTLVTSLRVSLNKSYNIIHIHDEIMLNVLTGINDVKINDIINFLSNKGKNVFVIDVYRTPIERKMSEFFEKISPYHFNNTEKNISEYSLERISNRFNKLFPYLETGDHYFEQYNIINPISFDFNKKYTIQEINNIKYIKLRLCDSNLWEQILSNIFNIDIIIINDYKTENKEIGDLYKKFKQWYNIPANYFEIIKNDKYLNFYYNNDEKSQYLNLWLLKITDEFTPYSYHEYKFYINLCIENQYINDYQKDHYIDNGCFCKYCTDKRKDIYFKAKKGEKNFVKIIHNEVINEVINEEREKKINNIVGKIKLIKQKITYNKKKPLKDFTIQFYGKK
jgi:hypothetical protein